MKHLLDRIYAAQRAVSFRTQMQRFQAKADESAMWMLCWFYVLAALFLSRWLSS